MSCASARSPRRSNKEQAYAVIRGYPGRPSVSPGETLVLHISTNAPRFRVTFYRWLDDFVPMLQSGWLPGRELAPGSAADDWQWPAYEFAVPRDWPSAVYIAHLEEPDGERIHLALESAAALFVVRGAARSGLLYKIPLATYHAYNYTGGGCFYSNSPRSHDPPGSKVTLQRPGGGIGGIVHGALDYYDPSSPRQTFAHWDARFIQWLARNGYTPEFCTDFDIHHDPDLCKRYRFVLSVGHDEYWSQPMREHLEAYVESGGNLAFFGANLCWWRIHVIDEGCAIVCHQGGPKGALDHWWPSTGANRPEDSLTGVSYRHSGGWWDGPRQVGGYIVQCAEHWVFAGTGLRQSDSIAAHTWPPLVGYECDGAPLEDIDPRTGLAVLSRDATRCGTPRDFRLLAVAALGDGWQELPPRESQPDRG